MTIIDKLSEIKRLNHNIERYIDCLDEEEMTIPKRIEALAMIVEDLYDIPTLCLEIYSMTNSPVVQQRLSKITDNTADSIKLVLTTLREHYEG